MSEDQFYKKFYDYHQKAQDGKWLSMHINDTRNSDRVASKISLDTDSRLCVAYLQELIKMINELRLLHNMEHLK